MKYEVEIASHLQEDYGKTEIVSEIKLNKLKKDEFFKLTPEGKSVYHKIEYDRARKGYYCENFESGNERFIKANKIVFTGFIF